MNVRVAQVLSFHAGLWYDDYLEMSEYTIKLWMITQTYNAEEQNIAIGRIKNFIFGDIENTIFINSENKSKCKEFINAGLNVTTMPGEPVEQTIGIMLFHKLNAIMEERIKIVEIEISSGTGVVYLHSENENSENLVQPDWWQTPDLIHCDQELLQGDKVLNMPQASAWRDLELSWPEDITDTETGNVVVFADFKNNETK